MAGKDLIDSTMMSGKIARILGARPPEGFNYEMFLDEKGEKISKSKGNGLSLDDWMRYGGERSLEFYLFREPKKAKNLHLGLVPRAVDDYWQFRARWPEQPVEQRLGNPVHHIHSGTVPEPHALPLTFGLLLNLASLPGVADKATAWRFVQRYAPGTSPETDVELDELIGLAVTYARDFVVPGLKRRTPTESEAEALRDLDSFLAQLAPDTPADEIQNGVFEVGKRHYGKERLKDWFQATYETLLGASQGPRLGSFIALYGVDNSRRLIAEALA
jgi:lysyl-tRNA synthetase class 1